MKVIGIVLSLVLPFLIFSNPSQASRDTLDVPSNVAVTVSNPAHGSDDFWRWASPIGVSLTVGLVASWLSYKAAKKKIDEDGKNTDKQIKASAATVEKTLAANAKALEQQLTAKADESRENLRIAAETARNQIDSSKENVEKQIRASSVSANRQHWINKLRDNIALYLQSCGTLSTSELTNRSNKHEIIDTIFRVGYEIELLLNPEEPDHNDLVIAIKNARELAQSGSYPLIPDSLESIAVLTKPILKREWERVKSGD